MLFGPLVWWELVRLARRGQALRARILLLYALLLAIIVFAFTYRREPVAFFLGTATIPRADAAEFARWLVFALLEAQLLLVAIVTPAYAVAAIAEDKDRGSLQLLLTTALTDREIVWGKAVARALFILAAVASGIPVLMFCALLGSVDIGLIATGYALTAGTVTLSVGIGINAACRAPDSRGALIRAYVQSAVFVGGTLITPLVCFTPFGMLLASLISDSNQPLEMCVYGVVYPLVQVVGGCHLIAEATRELRKAGATSTPPSPSAFPESPRGRPEPVVFESPEILPTGMGVLGAHDDPVLWRERHAKAHPISLVNVLMIVATMIALVLFFVGGWKLWKRAMQALDPNEVTRFLQPGVVESPFQGGPLLIAAGVIASGGCLLTLAVGVTGCVAGERVRGTLDSLLATTLNRRRILRAKIQAQAEQVLVFAAVAVAGLGAGFGAEGGVVFGLAMVAAFVGGSALVVGLAAWLSVRCATSVGAFRLCLPGLIGVGCMPLLAWFFTDWENTAPATEVLAWCAGALLLAGAAMWWCAGAELERGE